MPYRKEVNHNLLLGAQARGRVGDLDAESSCPGRTKIMSDVFGKVMGAGRKEGNRDSPFKDGDAVTRADVVCDLRRESLVVHQQEIQLPDVADQELLEAVGQEVTGLHGK